ncbi:MAG: hypothetical protein ACSHYA_19020 [Opitutaceae bacterium]
MKKYIKILLIPVLLLGNGASRAMAGDEALAAVGGFLGGILATKAYDHHHRNHCAPSPHHQHRSKSSCSHQVSYKVVFVNEWVPGYWEVSRNRCGDRVRTWVAGYNKKIRKQVPVSCGCGSHQREYARHGRR